MITLVEHVSSFNLLLMFLVEHVSSFNLLLMFFSLEFAFSVKLEQGSVTTLIEEKGIVKGVIYKNKAGEEMRAYAPLTIVCDGCFSNLRKSLSAPKVMMKCQA